MNVDEEITSWLDRIGLAQSAGVSAENAIDLDILPDLTEVDLRLGVAPGHRKRILRAIAALSPARSVAAFAAHAPGSL